jgi:hypothetical protein
MKMYNLSKDSSDVSRGVDVAILAVVVFAFSFVGNKQEILGNTYI